MVSRAAELAQPSARACVERPNHLPPGGRGRRAAAGGGGLLFLLAISVVAAQERAEPASVPKHLLTAEALLAEVAPEHASYRHKNNVVRRKTSGEPAVCHADCSGLVNWLLLDAAGQPPGALERWFRSRRPVARHYVDAIVAEKYFRRVRRLQDCLPGDVVAMKYPKDSENTGHVMLVRERPKKRTATAPLVPDTEQWEVRIIDSTRSPHGDDSRRGKDGKPREGLGSGLFRIYANAGGEPVGYAWGLSAKSEFRPLKERPIVVGRFLPDGNKEAHASVKKAAALAPGGMPKL